SPFFGCYGDEFATTPTFDKLASEGVLYENAFANAPVCAPARSTIITGMYPPSMGTQNMRSRYPTPESIKFFPQYLREAGYYCTNNAKEDYNMIKPEGVWDESSRKAHYKNRKDGQPFFAIFNLGVSHESSIHKSIPNDSLRHNPAKVKLPPYHPDTPEMRHDWAQYYDKIEDLDGQVAAILKELEDAGLAENTIVGYYGDHGGVIARSKRFVYESGTHVPMIWRFPDKYKHLAPAKSGSKLDRLVSFVDLAPTMLSLVGVEVPEYMQGKAFLGDQQTQPREYVHLFRGRMDERIDMVRAVRNKQFRYIKNYMPHRIYGQYIEYLWRAPSCRSWEEAYKAGTCNKAQSAFWEQKPPEELYDVTVDPWEVNNLADDPKYADVLERMRGEKERWMSEIRDTGLMPEGEMSTRNETQSSFEYVHSDAYSFEKIKTAADVATMRDTGKLDEIISFLKDENPLVRYWGATGCLILGEAAKSAQNDLKELLVDKNADVRIAAAEALCNLGESGVATPVLIEALNEDNLMVRVHVLNSLEILGGEVAKAAIPKVKELVDGREDRGYDIRAGKRLVEIYE
ncbi:MAG: sulfatase-like hydrolase/transferase, partial [Cyclobacteriaceae bacterium]|nr:sulfatase-like hydrolase/transferase [Cyclobacteriaceae bacterium]